MPPVPPRPAPPADELTDPAATKTRLAEVLHVAMELGLGMARTGEVRALQGLASLTRAYKELIVPDAAPAATGDAPIFRIETSAAPLLEEEDEPCPPSGTSSLPVSVPATH